MGSCASSTEFFDVWTRIASQNIDALMLLGDTPYIDSTAREVNRSRHREFLSIPPLMQLGASTPIWGTWDDHDFGSSDDVAWCIFQFSIHWAYFIRSVCICH